MRAKLPEHSMLMRTPLYQVDGLVVPGLQICPVAKDPSDVIYTVTPYGANRLDLISQLFYDTPELWWLIAEINGILDPLAGVEPGMTLRIPTKSRLSKEGVLIG